MKCVSKLRMLTAVVFAVVLIASVQPSFANPWCWWGCTPAPTNPITVTPHQVPEINVYSGGAAVVVLLLGVLLIRERFNRS